MVRSKKLDELRGHNSPHFHFIGLQVTLLWLSRITSRLPKQIIVTDKIDNISTEPFAGGSFAEVLTATYCGKSVALKRIRTFRNFTPEQRYRRRRVSFN